VLGLSPTAYDFVPPKVYAWNVGLQHKLMSKLIFDIAYVGSSSKDLLRHANINAVPLGATLASANQDPTSTSTSTLPGAKALPTDLLRPYQGYGTINMYDYTGWGNYHSLQTSLSRRFENGLMFSVFYVWSKNLTVNNDDFAGGVPYAGDEAKIKQYDYSYSQWDRPQNFVVNFIYQTPKVAEGVMGVIANNWQVSGIFRWASGRPYTVGFSIPGVGNANLSGSDNPAARIVVTCDPGSGSSGDPYKQLDTSCFGPPQPGSQGLESARYFVHGPATNNLDLSLSKTFVIHKQLRMEVRLDAFNALNHTQYTGVNATANFASLTDKTITNLPYDSSGNLIRNNGFGSINGVAPPLTLQLVTRLTF
jgi:hypothetical protein